ncbi:bifunctional folylpolyglutamate synthase/dihydrofolate synthase [Gordonibacter sp. An230]|uniref:bifunctional folylpolyglutamate synthase/dihydrofolate synthase n=1 Tax=Gordonibacter sp. An230 TaxID=1965592 RepID=UPI000B39A6C4|nr:folylpolyglutamate synthase/dihydrofolate synthase family protein [Gordonibacter sp. An230]OUO91338.1 bifunctional folylpolyglutamate synthase/dihydrofolate synthase [Gordonibacter sp. An230]
MSFDPIAYINEPRWLESRLGLGRIAELLDRLGRPQDRLKFVHVAGTNGKGSTCAYLAAILQAAGFRTGLFTSPYLVAFEERIRVDGANISLADLTEATLIVKERAEAMADHPTEFELMTAVSLVHFARRNCDVVVLEVGLGGRLDSTNVIDAPEVAVIARIGLDHTALLGSTLAAIAGEKAGIVKRGSAVVSWPQEPEAMAVVERAAAECGCEVAIPDFTALEVGSVSWEESEAHGTVALGENKGAVGVARALDAPGADAPVDMLEATCTSNSTAAPEVLARSFTYRGERYTTRLLGSYQPANAALAIEVACALRDRGWRIGAAAVRSGIAFAEWPGRFEVLADPAPDAAGRRFVVDGGHNPQGARALADSLSDVFPGERPVFIVGVLEDKDYPAMVRAVLPLGAAFVCVSPENPRALPAEKLASAIRREEQDVPGRSARARLHVASDFNDAVSRARDLAGPGGLVCAFGSLYSVAAIKEGLRA